MTVELEWLDDGGVVFRGRGRMGGEESVALNRELYTPRERIARIRYQIIDLLAVSAFDIAPVEIRTLADQDSAAASLNPEMIIAIVMTDRLAYGMNRMYAAYFGGDDENVRLFHDLDEAKAWIRSRLPDAHP